MKTAILLLLFSTIAYAAPAPKSKCRPPVPRLKMVIRDNNVIDLTHEYNESAPYFPSDPHGFEITSTFKGYLGDTIKYFLYYNSYRQPEHFGTHVDSPNHFYEHGISVSQIALQGRLIGRGHLINMKRNNEILDGNYMISVKDIKKWETTNGKIRSKSIVLFYTGFGDFFFDRDAYLGTNRTGEDAVPHLRFPGLAPEAAEFLINNRCIGAVGIDTLSIDVGNSLIYGAHTSLTKAGVPIFENVGNLHELAKYKNKFTVIALPQKITKGSGAATRIIAVMG